MSTLKTVLQGKIAEHRPRTMKLLKEHSDVKVGEVTIGQAIGGARGVRCLVTDISYLDPMEGIRSSVLSALKTMALSSMFQLS